MNAHSIRSVSILTLTAVCLWLAPSTASAAFTTTISAAGVQTSAVAGVTTENFNFLPTGTYITYINFVDGFTIAGDAGGVFGISASNIYGGASGTNYFSVGDPSTQPSAPASATMTFTSSKTYFGLWLSAIDDGNKLEFFSGATSVGLYDANGLAASLPATYLGGNGPAEKAAYLNFTGITFDKVVFSSRQGSGFEADNISFINNPANAVPEPTTMTLGLIGTLMGAGIARLRRKTVVA